VYEPSELNAISLAALNLYSAGHVVIEKQRMDSVMVERSRQTADSLLGKAARVFEDDAILAYSVPKSATSTLSSVWLDTGWFSLERLPDLGPDGRPLRWHWMGDSARVGIISSESARIRLKFIAQAFGRARRIQLALNGSVVATIAISTDRTDYETPTFDIAPGGGFLELKSLDGADSPGQDLRRLSIALFRLDLLKT